MTFSLDVFDKVLKVKLQKTISECVKILLKVCFAESNFTELTDQFLEVLVADVK